MMKIYHGRQRKVNETCVVRAQGAESEMFRGLYGVSYAQWLWVNLDIQSSNHKADDEVVGIASATSAELFRFDVTKPWNVRLRHQ